ncbi:aldose epimerase family protein [Amycolatopsis taiwanensis]|uniref:Aldose 1-epimerase n=1 Tax=Amycolatopsis taiwanensis TaxID=342230 RepID=A0A9W6R5N8_9PSEU|nr:aldose epimerase family protein [Amycolatopsis taiwanensis]GLY69451.1 aldose 1-epimerase [Amycolatopsis taiwanensis]
MSIYRRSRTALAIAAVALAALGFTTVTSSATQDSAANPPTVSKEYFGQADGKAVYRYTLSNAAGMRVRILSYGGIIQTLDVPDRHGRSANVVLGFPTLADYVAKNSPAQGGGVYFGALIGRYANRIAKGTFTLDGVTYHVPVNNNGNSLHGGTSGFNQKVWDAQETSGPDSAGLLLRLVSPDGDQGYPGTLTTTVKYTLDNQNRLTIGYQATTDKPTVLNLTNHTYWNLAGEASGNVYDQQLMINADRYTPTDSTQIPTGALAPVQGTPFDLRTPTPIGAHIADNNPQLLIGQGYDHNWVLNRTDGTSLSLAVRAVDPASGRVLTVLTTQPGVQFYSGNFLTGTLVGTGGKTYRQSYGFALETQHFPDSPNHPGFPSTVLRPGQTYDQTTVFALSAQ